MSEPEDHPHRVFVAIPLYAANDRGYAAYFREQGEYTQELDQMTHIDLMVQLPEGYQTTNSADVYEDIRKTTRFSLKIDDLPCLLLEDDEDHRILMRIEDEPSILRATFRSLCEVLRHANEHTTLVIIAEQLIERRPDLQIVNLKHETINPKTSPMIEDYIWYVKATFREGRQTSEGSAVAIRLKPIDGPDQTFLLTCEHVLRGESAHGKPNHGPVAAEADIRAWAPGTAKSDDQGIAVSIVDDIRRVAREGIDPDAEFAATNDWVVLKIMNANAANAGKAVWKSDWAQDSPEGKEFTIVGYPGGEEAYVRGIVKPTSVKPPAHFYGEENGVITLSGDQTKPGMSGGGAFEFLGAGKQGRFYGLHRARYEELGMVHVLDTAYIRERIESADVPYSIAERREVPVEKHVKTPPQPAPHDETRHRTEGRHQPEPPKRKPTWFTLIIGIFIVGAMIILLLGLHPFGGSPRAEVPITLQERELAENGTQIELEPLSGERLDLEPDGIKLDEVQLTEELRKLLLPLLPGLHYEVKDLRERHREGTEVLGQPVVVYWKSRLSATIQAIEQGKDAEIRAALAEVDPQTVRLGITLQTPLQGKIDARAFTDNPEVEIARVDTKYTTRLVASLQATLVFDADRSRLLEVKIPQWDVRFQETRFEHALADKLAPLVQDYLNKKSRDEAAKLLEKVQQDLQRTIQSSTQPE